jgi:hypothetical protein
VGGFVRHIFDSRLRIAGGLLGVALQFLNGIRKGGTLVIGGSCSDVSLAGRHPFSNAPSSEDISYASIV